MTAKEVPAKVHEPKPVFVTKGLDKQDEHIDTLEEYFSQMKQVTVEPACGNLDLLTFAACSLWFGVIAIRGSGDYDEVPNQGNPGASTSFDVEPFHHPLITKDISSLSKEEIDAFWEEAYDEQIEENMIRDEKLLNGNVREIIGRNTPDPDDLHILEGPERLPLPPASDCKVPLIQPPEIPEPTLPSDEDYDELFNFSDSEESQEAHAFTPRKREKKRSVAQEMQRVNDYLNPPLIKSASKRGAKGGAIDPFADDPLVVEERQRNADRIRNELRLERVIQYQKKLRIRAGLEQPEPEPIPPPKPKSHSAPPAPEPRELSPEPFMCTTKYEKYNPIGLIYLSTSQNYEDPLHLGECMLGFYVDPAHRHRPNLSDALDAVVAVAFRDHGCHRIQSIVVDNPDKLYSLQTLANAGFSQEGMRRRAFFSPVGHEWKDVHYLAMLAMEWSVDLGGYYRIRPKSLWDEVLSRHRWEQEELLRLEDRSLKRTHSTETIRESASSTTAAQDLLEAETTNSPSKRRRLMQNYRDRTSSVSSSSSAASSSTHSPGSSYDTGFESDWSIVSSLARFSLPSSPGSSHFSFHDDSDGYMSSTSAMSFIDRDFRG
ncbi:hypothetical protein CVT24_012260 [Panaeolus cyanescens]|uniref:Uncharacterized protein n=1 Tax=Panaeolus cyanescens TaxID=181874 RepID=A0A409W5S9_9AGAR|nr:hypothetical protein CVT24_012260 [Panaeolus cyanescens]